MQGGESCRNICVVPFSLCKTTTLRVEPSAAVQPAQTSSDSHHCQHHHRKQRNNKKRLFIVIIVAKPQSWRRLNIITPALSTP